MFFIQMRRTVFLLIFILSYTLLFAQADSEALRKGSMIRQSMLKAFGGERNINKVKAVEYTAIGTSYQGDSSVSTRTTYRLDLKRRYISATSHNGSSTHVKAIDGNGAWQEAGGTREPLSPEEKAQLERIFFLNFLAMLQNQDLRFEFVLTCQYKGHPADIVRVSNPENPSQSVSLVVSKDNGTVLASTQWNPEKPDQSIYYADELEYERLHQGVVFPLAYQLFVDGDLASEGRIVDIRIVK